MPTEHRSLVFREDELKLAAVEHCHAIGTPLPASQPDGVRIGTDPTEAVCLRFGKPGTQISEIKLTSYDVLEALIGYCRMTDIPIPVDGDKMLRAESGGLRLTIRSDEAQRAA